MKTIGVAFGTALLLATAGADGSVRFWNWTTGQLVRTLPAHDAAVTSPAFHPDGGFLASAVNQ